MLNIEDEELIFEVQKRTNFTIDPVQLNAFEVDTVLDRAYPDDRLTCRTPTTPGRSCGRTRTS
ncbi:MAG: hypothetical protein CMJ18_22900 [Phycisphaeraceae bacterium]|nr:hypothetical protein [Phycisphaeraceae bacterium]